MAISFDHFVYEGEKIDINPPLIFKSFLLKDRTINIINEDLRINLYGKNKEDIEVLFESEMIILWQNYALQKDINLTDDGRKIKNDLLKRVKKD